ncbi:protein-glutamate O-methyltransferase CheR [Bacillus sp. BRMEA1]|uniref:CheR family methyltransferase n=1 Tax=Neobacillus endophyticus TaxID=2738405 RepID=UPI0015667826|nr:protein-glutamate O-methyltransferase CheR [Neobacillus endophyticus]NRD79358.1 protein-glutamate O-methyltransferase CheR [Neobacillus endophyticus]
MQDNGLLTLSQMIYDYCGLKYMDRLSTLKDKISKRLNELGTSHLEYCRFLKTSPNEWDVLMEILTINETYFYREENQLNECCSIVLPKLREKNFNKPLRIWSAACSTGEEAFTLAMLIQESGKFPQGSVEIVGTDINKKVLQKAEKGWYHNGSFAFRRIPQNLFKKYFEEENNGYKVKSSIQNMIKFQYLNLLDQTKVSQLGKFDVIFCRNVLIYFDQETTKRVIKSLHQNLSPDGFLFLGHAESITDMALGFQKVDSDKTFYYRKESVHDEKVRYISS